MTKIPEAYSELIEWMKPLCRFHKIDDFIVTDHKENRLRIKIYTKDHCYHISAVLPSIEDKTCTSCHSTKTKKLETGDTEEIYIMCQKTNCLQHNATRWGYLGCTVKTRKPRAGEDWNRGQDLADGGYIKKTFNEIVNDIVAYELVKVVKPVKPKILEDKLLLTLTPVFSDDKYIEIVLPLSAPSFWSPTMKIYRKCKKCGRLKSFYQ